MEVCGFDFDGLDFGIGDDDALGSGTPSNLGTLEKEMDFVSHGGSDVGAFCSTGPLEQAAQSNGQATDVLYFHTDGRGSISAVTDSSTLNSQPEQDSYDEWGRRRNASGSTAGTADMVDPPTSSISSITTHGYTGAEHAQDLGMIQIGGRFWDPMTASFVHGVGGYHLCNNNPTSCLSAAMPSAGMNGARAVWNARGAMPAISMVSYSAIQSVGLGTSAGEALPNHAFFGAVQALGVALWTGLKSRQTTATDAMTGFILDWDKISLPAPATTATLQTASPGAAVSGTSPGVRSPTSDPYGLQSQIVVTGEAHATTSNDTQTAEQPAQTQAADPTHTGPAQPQDAPIALDSHWQKDKSWGAKVGVTPGAIDQPGKIDLFNPSSDEYQIFKKVPAESGFIIVGAHGAPDSIQDQHYDKIPAAAIAQMIQDAAKAWNMTLAGKQLEFMACNTGKDAAAGVAEQVGSILHLNAWAPSDYGWLNSKGGFFVAPMIKPCPSCNEVPDYDHAQQGQYKGMNFIPYHQPPS